MNLSSDKRSNARRAWDEDIDIVIPNNDLNHSETITARTFDISSTGMGISVKKLLKKGHIISFAKEQEKWQLPDKGVVIWSFNDGEDYRVGLEFLL